MNNLLPRAAPEKGWKIPVRKLPPEVNQIIEGVQSAVKEATGKTPQKWQVIAWVFETATPILSNALAVAILNWHDANPAPPKRKKK